MPLEVHLPNAMGANHSVPVLRALPNSCIKVTKQHDFVTSWNTVECIIKLASQARLISLREYIVWPQVVLILLSGGGYKIHPN